jgi:hypothetical protein
MAMVTYKMMKKGRRRNEIGLRKTALVSIFKRRHRGKGTNEKSATFLGHDFS